MAPIRLHDTRSGDLRELVPRADRRVGIYVCGPTVYDRIQELRARGREVRDAAAGPQLVRGDR
jgi:cysteinyl-tRNA synthetase